ncbi:MAG: phospholipid transport system transporter-binding protein [bacterium]|jgi:phospholipid transport system transporter-binding protein
MNASSAILETSVVYDAGVCQVAGPLNFHTAGDALSAVDVLIRQHPALEIDLAGVSECNSVGLALMIEWLAIARREKHSVTFNKIPDSLRQLAGVCQVDGLI